MAISVSIHLWLYSCLYISGYIRGYMSGYACGCISVAISVALYICQANPRLYLCLYSKCGYNRGYNCGYNCSYIPVHNFCSANEQNKSKLPQNKTTQNTIVNISNGQFQCSAKFLLKHEKRNPSPQLKRAYQK